MYGKKYDVKMSEQEDMFMLRHAETALYVAVCSDNKKAGTNYVCNTNTNTNGSWINIGKFDILADHLLFQSHHLFRFHNGIPNSSYFDKGSVILFQDGDIVDTIIDFFGFMILMTTSELARRVIKPGGVVNNITNTYKKLKKEKKQMRSNKFFGQFLGYNIPTNTKEEIDAFQRLFSY